MGQGATTSALFPFALWSFVLVPFALSSHLLYNLKIHYKIAFIGILECNLNMKCGNFFFENSQIAVLISSSKFIMTERLLNNKRGKKT